MISIFIMYSNDRRSQLDLTLSFLRQMEGYNQCQKTLIVDGKAKSTVEEFNSIEVPRINNEFNWSYMWQAGVGSARFDKVLYLDSDRLLPRNFLTLINEQLQDNGQFIFTSKHLTAIAPLTQIECEEIVNGNFEDVFRFQGKLKYEVRHKEPFHGPGKNVMSGSTAFTKQTYVELLGVDPWYRGHGAFADSDFHMTAAKAGCRFIDLDITELHYHHTKSESGGIVDKNVLALQGLDNFIYYCIKWSLPTILAENLALKCQIKKPGLYVKNKIKEYQLFSKPYL